MENRKSLIVCLFFLFPFVSIAYDGMSTHRAITQEAIKLFQATYPQYSFSTDDIATIENGSFLEDSPETRCMDHFFDPIHNKGLYLYETSKEWAKDTAGQSRLADEYNPFKGYFSSASDYSWDRGIYEYVHGDKKRGLETLGHIVHLIEDKSVPDHTRLDNHYYGSPYEEWTQQFNRSTIGNISGELIGKGERPTLYSDLDSYFDSMARYSNNNFFSVDTIKSYSLPNIQSEKWEKIPNGKEQLFGYGEIMNKKHKLTAMEKNRNLQNGEVTVTYIFDDPFHLVMSDYWNLLSRQAVLHSAGVIKLFFDEVAKERQTNALLEKNKSFATKTYEKIANKLDSALNTVLATAEKVKSLAANTSALPPEIPIIANQPKPTTTDPLLVSKPKDPVKENVTTITQSQLTLLDQMTAMLLEMKRQLFASQGVGDDKALSGNLNTGRSGILARAASLLSGSSGSNEEIKKVVDDLSLGDEATTTVFIDAPTIASPTTTEIFLNSKMLTVSGTASSGQIIFNSFNSATTSVNASGTWQMNLSNLPEGSTTISFKAGDGLGNLSDPVTLDVNVDTVPLAVSVSASECEGSLLANACWLPEQTDVHLKFDASKAGNYSYRIIKRYANWQTYYDRMMDERWNPETAAQNPAGNNDPLATVADTNYTAQISSDFTQLEIELLKDDTVVASTTKDFFVGRKDFVRVNEFSPAGTKASGADNWVELTNKDELGYIVDLSKVRLKINDQAYDLTGQIASRDGNGEGEYYLIEAGDDNVVSDVSADKIIPQIEKINSLQLVYSFGEKEMVIDEIANFGDYSSEAGRSITRTDFFNSETHRDFQSSHDTVINGHDRNGDQIIGTPRQENYIFIDILG